MMRETVETLGPPGVLISEVEVLAQHGPEQPVHEATAIVKALTVLLGPGQNQPGRHKIQARPVALSDQEEPPTQAALRPVVVLRRQLRQEVRPVAGYDSAELWTDPRQLC